MYHPSSLNEAEEYIEFYNAGPEAADLSGWTFTDGVEYTFPVDTILETGAYLILSPSPEAFFQRYGEARVLGGYQGALSNEGETLELINTAGELADRVEYKEEEGWPKSADGFGASLARIHPNMPSSYPQSWRAEIDGGTPGAVNTILIDQPFPIVADISQNPVIPNSNETVQITCRIVFNKNVEEVFLFYKEESEETFIPAEMFDDGKHSDGLAGDGVYGGQAPPLPHGSTVEFYIEAVGEGSVYGYFPWNALKQTACYLVDNSEYETDLPLYRVIMRKEDEMELRSRDPTSDVELDSSFVFGDDIYYNVKIRFRGRGSRHVEPKSYRLNFADSRYFGTMKKINLNGHEPDRQFIGLECFKTLRMPASEKRMIALVFNWTFYPHYIQVERANQQMLERLFGNGDGNLYRGRTVGELGLPWGRFKPVYLSLHQRDQSIRKRLYGYHPPVRCVLQHYG